MDSSNSNGSRNKMKISFLLVTLVSLMWASPGFAQWSIGTKVGIMSVAFEDADVDDAPVNAGVVFGYEIASLLPGLSVELDVTRSVAPGSVVNADLSVNSQGIYLAYRTGKQLYAKGRLGFMDASLTGNLAEDEGGETYGVGVGWRFDAFSVELDYTSIDDDVSFSSIGVLYQF